MKIGIDLRPLQTAQSYRRGIGNYVHNQIGRLVDIADRERLVLFYDPSRPAPALLESLAPAGHWQAAALPAPAGPPPAGAADDFAQSRSLVAGLADHDLDVFHITSPFEWEIALSASLGARRTVATLYDLIPLIYKDIYLPASSAVGRSRYERRLHILSRADRLMAISESARRDAVVLAGVPGGRIDVIHAGADAAFRRLPGAEASLPARAKWNLPDSYILSILGYHYTKNIDGAIAAYSRLPATVRAATPLVIVCRLGDTERDAVQGIAAGHGVAGRVILTGEVEPDDLVGLYNGATVFFYPTRYDGFGLPVLEAMQCGTPVVASAASSIPEVAGDAALLADPEDHAALARHLEAVLADADLQISLADRGQAQARRFSWQRTAEATLQVYRRAVERGPAPEISLPAGRLRIAYWSPLNPMKSGISDYSEYLLLELVKHVDIDVFVDGYLPANGSVARTLDVFDARDYTAVARSRQYDVNLYQVGNSPFHEYMLQPMAARPGVAVLHDFVLNGLMHQMTEAQGDRARYLELVEANEGPGARAEVARALETGTLDMYRYPLNRQVVESSRAVIVHSQWVRDSLQRRGETPPIDVIPHGVNLLPSGAAFRRQARRELSLPEPAYIVGVFGRIVPTKRYDVVVRAFARLQTAFPHARLVFVGQADYPVHADHLAWLAARYGVSQVVHVTGYVAESVMNQYLQAVDVSVNLRYPTAGETSGTLCRALGACLPVLATANEAFGEFPDACVWKVGLGEREEDELVAYLAELALHPDLRQRMGEEAGRYVSQHATWEKVAAAYAGVLRATAAMAGHHPGMQSTHRPATTRAQTEHT